MKVKKINLIALILLISIVSIIWANVLLRQNQSIRINNSSPIWRGIVPGVTNKSEVISVLGEPTYIFGCLERNGEMRMFTYLSFRFDCLSKKNVVLVYEERAVSNPDVPLLQEIHLRNEKVLYIVEDLLLDTVIDDMGEYIPTMTVEQLIKKYGVPERVTWSMRSPHYNAILLCDKGLIAHASKYSVRWIYYFEPTTIDQCFEIFQFDISQNNPFPDSDVVGTEDPWGFNKNP